LVLYFEGSILYFSQNICLNSIKISGSNHQVCAIQPSYIVTVNRNVTGLNCPPIVVIRNPGNFEYRIKISVAATLAVRGLEMKRQMNSHELIAIWKTEEQKPFSGWDYSHLEGKMFIEQPPWSYPALVIELMHSHFSLLDMGTGGGEFLLNLRKDWPMKVTATEAYPPNQKLAKERLAGLEARLIDVNQESDLSPFVDGEFDLVINRHSGFEPTEVARILAPDGIFLTQQVHGLSSLDLLSCFGAEPRYPEATPEYYLPRMKDAHLKISDFREWSGKMSFIDVGALVYYLKAVPWIVDGFSVETHSEHLLLLQSKLEKDGILNFGLRRYLIECQRQMASN
jgi:SAM-dependent methyltransferase